MIVHLFGVFRFFTVNFTVDLFIFCDRNRRIVDRVEGVEFSRPAYGGVYSLGDGVILSRTSQSESSHAT